MPVSLVDGYVVCANNAAITNTAKSGSIKVTKMDVQPGVFEIGSYDAFSAGKNSIALSINGCSTKGAGALTLAENAFPAIPAEKSLAIRYRAKVSASEAVTNVNAATAVSYTHLASSSMKMRTKLPPKCSTRFSAAEKARTFRFYNASPTSHPTI